MSKVSAPLALRPRIEADVPRAAMVLSAGLGRRMRPLTATRPKPLIQVAGRPLIDYSFDSLVRAGVGEAVVNTHYLADQVEAHVKRVPADLTIHLSDERQQLLETGGGVKKALDLIDADPFLILNSDNILMDGPCDTLSLLAQRWDPEAMDALLLLVPLSRANGYDGHGDFHMTQSGELTRRKGSRVAPFVYSGAQIIKKSAFGGTSDGKFSLNVVFDKLLEEGRLYGFAHQGGWYHVGTPEAVPDTEARLRGE